MSDYSACPHCEREAEKVISSNWFPIYSCDEYGENIVLRMDRHARNATHQAIVRLEKCMPKSTG